jgi:hypothetical protein
MEWIATDGPCAGNSGGRALTRALLESAGGRLEEVVFSVRAANRKTARRTGDEANAFKGSVESAVMTSPAARY